MKQTGGVQTGKTEAAEWSLTKESELRFEVEKPVSMKLLEGVAEVFGTEVPPNKTLTFDVGSKVAVFTWHGCKVQLEGEAQHAYVSVETPMVTYLNIHAVLEKMREKAEALGGNGPRVLVAGATDVGKTTLCHLLLNYAVRWDRHPVFVDIDCGQNSISVPGTIAALPVDKAANIEGGGFTAQAPLVFHYGWTSPERNKQLYKVLIDELARLVGERAKAIPDSRIGGCVINTCGWIDAFGYEALVHAAQAFEVNTILVLDHERLYNQLKMAFNSSKEVQVVLLPKSGGVVARSKTTRSQSRDRSVYSYFYGSNQETFYPHSFDVKFTEVQIYKIGSPSVPDSCLPIDMKRSNHETELVSVDPSPDLLHTLCGLSLANTLDEDLVRTNLAGFICITNVDMERKVLTVLSPAPHPLPRCFLLVSSVRFMDLK